MKQPKKTAVEALGVFSRVFQRFGTAKQQEVLGSAGSAGSASDASKPDAEPAEPGTSAEPAEPSTGSAGSASFASQPDAPASAWPGTCLYLYIAYI